MMIVVIVVIVNVSVLTSIEHVHLRDLSWQWIVQFEINAPSIKGMSV